MNNQNNDPIDKNDLLLLMEAYENTIKLNTTLLEQQKKLLESDVIHRDHVTKFNEFQINFNNKLNELITTISNLKILSDEQKQNINTAITKIDKLSDDSTNKLTDIKIQLYFALFGMVTLVGSIIGVFTQIYSLIKH